MEHYGAPPAATGYNYYAIRRALETDLAEAFTRTMMRERFPDVSESTLTRVLRDLKQEGIIARHGRGRNCYWEKVT